MLYLIQHYDLTLLSYMPVNYLCLFIYSRMLNIYAMTNLSIIMLMQILICVHFGGNHALQIPVYVSGTHHLSMYHISWLVSKVQISIYTPTLSIRTFQVFDIIKSNISLDYTFFNLFLFYFIFKLYNIVLVLPNMEMNPPQVYMCSPSWTLFPPPSPYPPSGSSQCTSPKHPVSCIEPGLEIRFIHDIIHVSKPFSQISPPSPSDYTFLTNVV